MGAQDGIQGSHAGHEPTSAEREKDLRDHVQSYEGFLSLMKWGTVFTLIVVTGVIWAIAN